jgi:hypothetical protein
MNQSENPAGCVGETLEMVERYARVAPEGLQLAASRLDNVLAGTF